ncbi:MAG: choice-of-anchor Q domain-containing protein [Albidovulum sp.]
MKLARALAMLGLSTALAGSPALAAVEHRQSTPAVSGTPLAVITLQSNAGGASSAYLPAAPTKVETGARGSKWVSVRKGSGAHTSGQATAAEKPRVNGGGSGSRVASKGIAGATGTTGAGAAPATSTTTVIATAASTTTTTTATGTTSQTGTTALATPAGTSGTAVPPGAVIWKNFDSLMSSGKVTGGDRIFLLSGYHGQLLVRDQQFASTVTIAPAAGAVAHADSIVVMNSRNVHIQGLKVWPRSSNAGNGALVRSYSNTNSITFTDLDVRGIATAGNYATWSITDWNNYQRTGFQVDGSNIIVARNRVTGIFNGIITLGKNALMEANIVDGFAGDAMRVLGDNSIVRGNKVQNCHQINASHTDGLQSWSRGPDGTPGAGTIRNVTIEDNKILEYVGTRSAITCRLQGISMFDGVYENFTIRNNLVVSTAYHGIAMAGGLNSQIVNNTVIHATGQAGKYPWIRLSSTKTGIASRNVTIANNLVTSNKVTSNPTNNIVETNNITVTNASTEFTSVASRDFTLRPTAKAIDAGAQLLAPNEDIVGAARPKGKAPDAGAYENF